MLISNHTVKYSVLNVDKIETERYNVRNLQNKIFAKVNYEC